MFYSQIEELVQESLNVQLPDENTIWNAINNQFVIAGEELDYIVNSVNHDNALIKVFVGGEDAEIVHIYIVKHLAHNIMYIFSAYNGELIFEKNI